MIRKSLVAAFSVALIFLAVMQAQDASRRVELRITDASRGYMRPLRTTTDRIAAIAGLESVTAIGARAGVMRFALKTTLSDEQIATALALEIVDAKDGKLLLAPPQSATASRAEARLAILAIADGLRKMGDAGPSERYGNGPGGDERPGIGGNMEQNLKALGLDSKLLEGKFYKTKDYHIDGNGGGFLIYAGAKWEGVAVGVNSEYGDYSGGDASETVEPDPKSNFVGARLSISSWNSGFWWADVQGLSLNESSITRDSPSYRDKSKLEVQHGGERVVAVLQGAAKYRFEGDNAKKAIESLLKGNLGQNRKIQNALKLEEDNWEPFYGQQTLTLSWFKDDAGHTRARVRAYHSRHPLHLDGDIDCDAANAAAFDFNKLEIHWNVGPEADAGVFERRRTEIAAGQTKIRDALFALDAAGLAEVRKAPLGGEALAAALKLKVEDLKGEFFSAADYNLRPQIFGDIEVAAGSPVVGCESWTLLNLAEKTTIRSYK
jgi:hypothetical protein